MIELFKGQPLHIKLGALLIWWWLWYLTWRFGPWNRDKGATDGKAD